MPGVCRAQSKNKPPDVNILNSGEFTNRR